MARVEEVETDEDEYGRQLVRNGRAAYMRQLEYGGRGPRRRQDYDDLTDDGESVVDGGDYDLYDHEDSTVAYAVQLAMRDKEDQLVEKALERIRRAQMLGKKNVRLSQRELDALERRRLQTDNPREARRPPPTGSASNTRPSSRRKSGGLPERAPGPPAGPYAPFAYGADAGWHPGGGAAGRPTSSSSANRPRTPTMQSLRPQQSNSPLRPGYPAFAERLPPNGRPQSMQPMHPRPLPDDPQWAPSYYNPMQMSSFAEPAPYQAQLPGDLRVGPQSHLNYPGGMSALPVQPRPSIPSVSVPPLRTRPVPSASESESESSEEESSEDSSEEDEVQIVSVVERPGPTGLQRRKVAGGRPRPRRGR